MTGRLPICVSDDSAAAFSSCSVCCSEAPITRCLRVGRASAYCDAPRLFLASACWRRVTAGLSLAHLNGLSRNNHASILVSSPSAHTCCLMSSLSSLGHVCSRSPNRSGRQAAPCLIRSGALVLWLSAFSHCVSSTFHHPPAPHATCSSNPSAVGLPCSPAA